VLSEKLLQLILLPTEVTANITFCIIAPFIIYLNADTDKLQILKENRNKTEIYLWTHLEYNKNILIVQLIFLDKFFIIILSLI
jgi:hypothetical protein